MKIGREQPSRVEERWPIQPPVPARPTRAPAKPVTMPAPEPVKEPEKVAA